jgi:hypothetical protein
MFSDINEHPRLKSSVFRIFEKIAIATNNYYQRSKLVRYFKSNHVGGNQTHEDGASQEVE